MERAYGFRKKSDLAELFRRGRRLDSRFFRLVVRPNRLNHARVAFIAPRALDKRAVARNRLRRRGREWARKDSRIFLRPVDAAIIFKKESMRIPRRSFYEALSSAMAQIP